MEIKNRFSGKVIFSDVSAAHLAGADLRAADLRGANLSDAHLSGADLRGADIHKGQAELIAISLGMSIT